jgi:hypothetical protein
MSNSVEEPELKLLASYAHHHRKGAKNHFKLGESLVGQAALEKQRILLTDVTRPQMTPSSVRTNRSRVLVCDGVRGMATARGHAYNRRRALSSSRRALSSTFNAIAYTPSPGL